MQLFHRHLGDQGPFLVILHGLFGSSDNWQTIGKALSELGYRVVLTDLRNHGQSPHDPTFDLDVMSDDLYELLLSQSISSPIIIGHSLGGKVAMRFACKFPSQLSALIVMDIAPKAYTIRHNDIVEALMKVSQHPMTSRKHVEEQLTPLVPDFAVRQWLMKSLFWKEKDRLDWRFNLPVIAQNLNQAVADCSCAKQIDTPSLFLRGANSDYVQEGDIGHIQSNFSAARIDTIPNAGHWLHTENPDGTLKSIVAFIKSTE
jgi:esterase